MAEKGVFFTRPLPSLDTIDKEVSQQLAARAALYGKRANVSPNFLQSFINGNNSFVRLTSGINIKGIPNAAGEHILHGGTLDKDKKLRAGISTDPFSESTGAYNFAEKEGYVPMAGITDVKIVNRGNSGFVREAQITVRCFSLEQLSIIEKLYLRPGFRCLLEWGHVVYAKGNDLTGDSITEQPTTTSTIDVDNGLVGIDKLKEEGSKLIADTQNNYEYMVGVIKNYDWSYETDGFTVNVELMGEGAVTTFIKSVYGGTDQEESKGSAEDAGVEFDSSNQSSFAGILSTINDADKRGNQEGDEIVEEADMDRINAALQKKYDASIKGIEELITSDGDSFEFKVYRAGFNAANGRPGGNRFNYISMRYFLGMINYFFLPRDSANTKNPDGKFNTTPEVDFYTSYADHFSIDPGVCLLPNQTGKYGLKTEGIISGKKEEDRADVLDIHLSTQFLYDQYKKLRKDDKNKPIDISIGTFLNNVLAEVELSLGGINQFVLYNDYYLDKKLGPSKIIDLQLTPRPEGQEDNYTVIIPKGKNSFLKDFSFNSTLSSSMINLITSQAILQGQDAGKNTSTGLAVFNSGISSRFTSAAQNDQKTLAKEYEKGKEDAKAKLEAEFKKLYEKGKYDKEAIEKALPNGASLIQQELDASLASSKPKRGHIGAKVNLTMMGIGGLKALQFFKIPDEVLPASYSEGLSVGFQISTVSHDINNNQWFTTIEANAVILSQD